MDAHLTKCLLYVELSLNFDVFTTHESWSVSTIEAKESNVRSEPYSIFELNQKLIKAFEYHITHTQIKKDVNKEKLL